MFVPTVEVWDASPARVLPEHVPPRRVAAAGGGKSWRSDQTEGMQGKTSNFPTVAHRS